MQGRSRTRDEPLLSGQLLPQGSQPLLPRQNSAAGRRPAAPEGQPPSAEPQQAAFEGAPPSADQSYGEQLHIRALQQKWSQHRCCHPGGTSALLRTRAAPRESVVVHKQHRIGGVCYGDCSAERCNGPEALGLHTAAATDFASICAEQHRHGADSNE